MTIDEVAGKIKSSTPDHKPALIAIDGFGGAGKTTLAEKLKATLGDAYVIHIDEFIIKEKLFEASWDKGSFDRKRLETQVFKPAASDKPIAYQKLVWAENQLSEPIAVPDVDYLIVEGISSQHPDIADYFDYKIWLDTPIEVAKERGKRRDRANGHQVDEQWEIWAQNDLDYRATYHPEQKADFVISNT